MLAKILKGSRDKRLLEMKLNESPAYGYYHYLTLVRNHLTDRCYDKCQALLVDNLKAQ